MSTLVIHSGYVYPPDVTEEDRALIAAALRKGVCPCESEAEDPGPEHLPTCPWSDPEYPEGTAF